jgi:uncharacterized protein YjlB
VPPETYRFDGEGGFPNSELPVLVYHDVAAARDAASCEQLFARHRWRAAWRDGIYNFHHFHSTAHEVLGVVSGTGSVILGGPSGCRFEVSSGDVLVLPAGTAHCNAGSSPDLLVVGAYPDAMRWDLRRGDAAELAEVTANIRAVPLPAADPVGGAEGFLPGAWSGR